MTTPELRQSLIDLQVAALEKVAQRQGLLANRAYLARLIEGAGIAGAIVALRRQSPAHPSWDDRDDRFFSDCATLVRP